MTENPILGWTTESSFGCLNPIRVGDLLVTKVKMNGSSGRFFRVGKPCLALGPAEDRINRELGCISVLIDGVIEDIYPTNLEFLSEAR
jgi:hypothetical protein